MNRLDPSPDLAVPAAARVRRARRRLLVLAVVPVLVATGCSSDKATETAPSPVPTPSTPPATSIPATPPAGSSPPPVTPVQPPGAGQTVVLDSDGLGFATGAATSRLRFGTAKATMVKALAASLGAGKESALPDCGQGPRRAVQYDGFSILLDSGSFVGWTERGSAERDLTTEDGIGLQATVTEVKQAYPDAAVTSGSVGPEFSSASGLSGLLDGTTAQSRVTSISGGETCTFR